MLAGRSKGERLSWTIILDLIVTSLALSNVLTGPAENKNETEAANECGSMVVAQVQRTALWFPLGKRLMRETAGTFPYALN